MVGLEVARALRDAGVVWRPRKGDRFAIPDRDLDDHVFVLSDMVVELVEVPDGDRVLAFNGTTEWALDALEANEAVWLPREDQLRELLGERFVALERLPGVTAGWAVTVRNGRDEVRHVDVDAEAAYVRAVLALLAG
ncbi:pilus assembly protein CpaE [Nocardioides sp. MAHUQ-72]|uniref:pilus assembly protein CpaE n=1 Tax=unclassified Nocardioides TaxID=2615069 RepID=UPI003618C6D8